MTAPLWYRGLATTPDDPAGGPFAAMLAKYGAKRFVSGHTPQQSRAITVRLGGRAVLIDTGMLTSVYKGRASALEIDGDKLTAIYEDGRVPLDGGTIRNIAPSRGQHNARSLHFAVIQDVKALLSRR